MTVAGTITIDAPPSVVFDIVADPRQHGRIDGSGTVKDTVTGPDRLTMDAQFSTNMRQGVPYTMKNTVVEFEPDRLIAWRHLGPHRWRYELEPVGEGSTKVTETWDDSAYPGFARAALKALGFVKRNQAGIDATLPKLKQAAEADAQADQANPQGGAR